MNKKTVKTTVFVLMLLVVALYFVSGTYARYTSEWEGNAATQVAKWAVLVNEKAASETLDVTFSAESNKYVAEGKFAPGVTLVGTIEVDLEGTEVAVDVAADVIDSAIEDVFGDVSDNITVTTSVNGVKGTTTTLELVDGKAFTKENGVVTVEIEITWTDTNTKEDNIVDTGLGVKAEEVTLPVTITVSQHVA